MYRDTILTPIEYNSKGKEEILMPDYSFLNLSSKRDF